MEGVGLTVTQSRFETQKTHFETGLKRVSGARLGFPETKGGFSRLGLAVWCEIAARGFPKTEGAICGNRLSLRAERGTERRFPETRPF